MSTKRAKYTLRNGFTSRNVTFKFDIFKFRELENEIDNKKSCLNFIYECQEIIYEK